MWARWEKWLRGREWLVLILIGVVVIRIPTLFEPYWYGDEGIYLTVGQAMRQGVKLYRQIHDNKPPLLYLVSALAGGSLFWFRFLAGAWNVATVVVFAGTFDIIFGKENRSWKYGAIITFGLITNLPLLEGNIANAENFFLLPVLAAFAILGKERITSAGIWWAGILIGLGALFKVPALLEAGVWPIYWLIETLNKKLGWGDWWKRCIILGLAALLPLILTVGYYQFTGSGTNYLSAIVGQNISYLSTWKEGGAGGGIFGVKGRAAVAVVLIAGIVVVNKRLKKQAIIVGTWWIVTLFAALLSGRPYPHYLLQMAGVLTCGIVILASGKRWERGLVTILIVVFAGAITFFRFWVYPVAGYYLNFAKWVIGRQTKQEYFAWFGPGVLRNYRISGIIAAGSKPSDRIFVWGDEPMIYALTRRLPATKYMAKYHVESFAAQDRTIEEVESNNPRYIVTFSDMRELPGLAQLILSKYLLEEKVDDVRIYRQMVGLTYIPIMR